MKKFLLIILLGFILSFLSNAHVELTNPVGDEVFAPNSTVNIEWNELVTHNTLNWDLYFSDDGGTTWTVIKENMAYETLNYSWKVPETLTEEGQIKIVQDNEGFDYTDISGKFTISNTSSTSKIADKETTRIYPNPFTSSATIKFENTEPTIHTLAIYDNFGRVVRKITTNGNDKISIARKNLKSGIYYFQLRDENKLKHSGKLVVR